MKLACFRKFMLTFKVRGYFKLVRIIADVPLQVGWIKQEGYMELLRFYGKFSLDVYWSPPPWILIHDDNRVTSTFRWKSFLKLRCHYHQQWIVLSSCRRISGPGRNFWRYGKHSSLVISFCFIVSSVLMWGKLPSLLLVSMERNLTRFGCDVML